MLSFEQSLPALRGNPFLTKAISMVADGFPVEEVERVMRREIDEMTGRHRKSASVLRKAAEIAPAMGLIGTLIGLVQMLGNLDDPSTIGPAMAVALMTTFYGAVLANMLFAPLAAKLERNSAEEALVYNVYLLAAVSIGRKENPRRLEMLLNALLPPAHARARLRLIARRVTATMRLLIVGQLNGQIGAASRIAMSHGAKVAHVDDVEGALHTLRSGRGADLVMVDVKLDIKALIGRLESERISVPVVGCGMGNDSEGAVRAIQAGAKEYIPLPPDAELIAAVLEAVTEENHAIITRDPQVTQVLGMAEQVAPSDASILITGESGTGKELLARYIHTKSKRAREKFISVNCAAIPENLLESELFGHEKGAFTGAVARRIGKFEEANGGTLLLDEISEMDLRLQAKLLRADPGARDRPRRRHAAGQGRHPHHRHLEPQHGGGGGEGRCSARTCSSASTSSTLLLPPLRSRPADIEALADHFIRKYAEANGVAGAAACPTKAGASCWAMSGAATCASWRTRCTAPCCSPAATTIDAGRHHPVQPAAPVRRDRRSRRGRHEWRRPSPSPCRPRPRPARWSARPSPRWSAT